MTRPRVHKPYCFAGKPAPCTGYFKDDRLPCVCGAEGKILSALARVAVPPKLLFKSHVQIMRAA